MQHHYSVSVITKSKKSQATCTTSQGKKDVNSGPGQQSGSWPVASCPPRCQGAAAGQADVRNAPRGHCQGQDCSRTYFQMEVKIWFKTLMITALHVQVTELQTKFWLDPRAQGQWHHLLSGCVRKSHRVGAWSSLTF